MLSEQQKKKQTYIFNLLDFDKNGFIEKDDFVGIGENLCIIRGDEMDTSESKNIMAVCEKLWADLKYYTDENRDEKCTLDEWLKFIEGKLADDHSDTYNNYIHSMVSDLFDLYDINGDGEISIDEYLDLFMSFRLEASLVAHSFKSIDINGDQHITKVEFEEAVRQFLHPENNPVLQG